MVVIEQDVSRHTQHLRPQHRGSRTQRQRDIRRTEHDDIYRRDPNERNHDGQWESTGQESVEYDRGERACEEHQEG